MKEELDVLKYVLSQRRDHGMVNIQDLELTESIEAWGLLQGIDGLQKCCDADHVLWGVTHVFFVPMNVYCIRVELVDSGRKGCDYHKALDDGWQNDVDKIYDLADLGDILATTEIPTLKGEWLITFHPQTR